MTIALLLGCSTIEAPLYKGAKSDHFDGEKFFSPWPIQQVDRTRSGGIFGFLFRRLTRSDPVPWPEWVETEPGPPPPARVTSGIRITFVGHSTLLIQTGGLNILTDPVWSQHVGPSRVLSVIRRKAPGIVWEELPEIDIVVISHNHYDHMDMRTLRRLNYRSKKQPIILVPLGNSALIREYNIQNSRDLDWWESFDTGQGIKVQAVPAQHWSTRALSDRDHVLWGGYVIHTPAGKIYFAGDTGYGDFVRQIKEKVGRIDYALLPIGAYMPEAFKKNHIDPIEAVKMHQELGARVSIPMHYGTFRQAEDGYEQPLVDLKSALEKAGLPESTFAIIKEGESWVSAK